LRCSVSRLGQVVNAIAWGVVPWAPPRATLVGLAASRTACASGRARQRLQRVQRRTALGVRRELGRRPAACGRTWSRPGVHRRGVGGASAASCRPAAWPLVLDELQRLGPSHELGHLVQRGRTTVVRSPTSRAPRVGLRRLPRRLEPRGRHRLNPGSFGRLGKLGVHGTQQAVGLLNFRTSSQPVPTGGRSCF